MNNCPICKSENVKVIYKIKNRPYSIYWKDTNYPTIDYSVSICLECDFLFQSSAYIDEKYDEIINEIYTGYEIMDPNLISFPMKEEKFEYIFEFLKNVNFSEITNVLEIGSNRGDFLFHLKNRFPHINILGIEPTKYFSDIKVPTINSTFSKELCSNKFDLIILKHVFEHIKYPKEFFLEITQVLTENGKIFIEVPNTISDLNDKLDMFEPAHVSFFTENSFKNMLEGTNFYIETANNKTHLCFLISKNKSNLNFQNYKLKNLIKEYENSIAKSVEYIKEYSKNGYKIVFYGFGSYFLWIYYLLKELLKDFEIFKIIDDSNKKIDLLFQNIKVENSKVISKYKDEKLLFIIASGDRNILNILENNISNFNLNNYKVIKPWNSNELV